MGDGMGQNQNQQAMLQCMMLSLGTDAQKSSTTDHSKTEG